MGDKKQTVRDQAVSAGGGLIGGALGALAGPETMGAIGGAVGSVGALLAAKYAPEYFANNPFKRYLNNRKIVGLLREKLRSELNYSFLDSQGDFDRGIRSMRSFLEAANAEDASIGTLESRLVRNFRWNLTFTDLSDAAYLQHVARLAKHCRTNGPVRIGCPAISCAVAAIIRDLHERFAEDLGLEFALSCNEINGRTFFDSLKVDCELDFAVGPLEALVLSDTERRLPLRIIGPIFGQRQRIFVNTKKRTGFRSGVWVFSKSSAKFQYQVGIGVPRIVEEQEFDDARQVPDLVESIPAGDMVIAWDPLSSVLDRRKDFAVVHNSEYLVHFVLLGHRHILAKNRFPVHDFLAIFLCEWRRRKQLSDDLVDALRRDRHFMTGFARGSGHQWTPEL